MNQSSMAQPDQIVRSRHRSLQVLRGDRRQRGGAGVGIDDDDRNGVGHVDHGRRDQRRPSARVPLSRDR